MTPGQVLSESGQQVLVRRAWRADGALERMRGLLGRSPLAQEEALLLKPCSSVHTFFMRYALDIVFISADGTVKKVVEHLAPWRTALCIGARATLELRAGAARRAGIATGQRLSMHWSEA